jgi:hypothetical protein
MAVMTARIEGRLKPAATLIMKKIVRRSQRALMKVDANNMRLSKNIAVISMPLWVILEETKPDAMEPINTPIAPIMNMEPA